MTTKAYMRNCKILYICKAERIEIRWQNWGKTVQENNEKRNVNLFTIFKNFLKIFYALFFFCIFFIPSYLIRIQNLKHFFFAPITKRTFTESLNSFTLYFKYCLHFFLYLCWISKHRNPLKSRNFMVLK